MDIQTVDVLLIVMTPNADRSDVGLDYFGDQCLAQIKAQGLPSVLGVLQVTYMWVL